MGCANSKPSVVEVKPETPPGKAVQSGEARDKVPPLR